MANKSIWNLAGIAKLIKLGQKGIQLISSGSPGTKVRVLNRTSTEAAQVLAPIEAADGTWEESLPTRKTILDRGGVGFYPIHGEIWGSGPPTANVSNEGQLYLVIETGGGYTIDEIYRSTLTGGSVYSWELVFDPVIPGNKNAALSFATDISGFDGYTLAAWNYNSNQWNGYISGPDSIVDNSIPRYDGTDGKKFQSSNALINDSSIIQASGIDARTSGGTLLVGASDADLVLVGRIGAEVALVEKQLVLNKGGTYASGSNVGFVIEESGINTGYITSSIDRNEFQMKVPGTAGIIRFIPGTDGFILSGASGGGGSSSVNVLQTSHGKSRGEILTFYDGSGWSYADASDADLLGVGMVSGVADADNYIVTLLGEVDGLTGLTPGDWYYASSTTPGAYTNIESTISNPVFIATASDTALVLPYRPAESGIGTTIKDNEFTATPAQTIFTLTDAPFSKDYLIVWVGGSIQMDSAYGIVGNTVTFTTPIAGGTLVKFRMFLGTTFNQGLGQYIIRSTPNILNASEENLGASSASYEIFEQTNPKLHVDVYFTAGDASPHVIFPSGEAVTTVKDTASSLNIYVTTGNLIIQNNLGAGAKTFVVFKKV